MGTHQRSFERYHPRPPTTSPSPRLGVHNPTPKLQSLLSQERVKLGTSNLADTITGSIRTKARKKLKKRERGRIQGLPKFLGYSLLSQERESCTKFKFCTHIHGIDPNKSPLKILAKVAVGVPRDSRKFP